jgi:uncharacterized membrane protein YfcA
VLAVSLAAGVLGSLLALGGGIIVVPARTLVLQRDRAIVIITTIVLTLLLTAFVLGRGGR